jgi:RNA polymerase sigma factor (sigma-70 family)
MLALAAKGGDHPHCVHARNALYLRHLSSINAMLTRAKRIVAAMWATDRSLEVDDVVQQTFLIFCDLLDNWHGNPKQEPFLSYLSRLMPSHASHFVRDTLHYRAKTRVIGHSSRQPVESAVDNQAEFDDDSDAIERSNYWSPVSGHSSQSSRWITLRYTLGLTTAQIADLCGVSPRTVDRHLKAAITQMRHELQSGWEDCA